MSEPMSSEQVDYWRDCPSCKALRAEVEGLKKYADLANVMVDDLTKENERLKDCLADALARVIENEDKVTELGQERDELQALVFVSGEEYSKWTALKQQLAASICDKQSVVQRLAVSEARVEQLEAENERLTAELRYQSLVADDNKAFAIDLTKENERLREDSLKLSNEAMFVLAQKIDLTAQLATVKQERDEAIIRYTGQANTAEQARNRAMAKLETARQQLAASEARVTALEAALRSIVDAFPVFNRKETTIGGKTNFTYWSPAGAMVDTELIAKAKEAL